MDSFRKLLDDTRDENFGMAMEVIELKNTRLTYQEARIEALEREVEKLNIEILNLQFQLKITEDANI